MILIDDAAGSTDLLSHPPLDRLGVACRLPSPAHSDTRADVAFDGCGPDNTTVRVGIEVKEITELASSLSTGRLQATQLPALLSLYDVRWLVVITGAHRRDPATGGLQVMRTIRVNGELKRGWVDFKIGERPVQFSYVYKFLSSPSFTQYKDENGEGIHFVTLYDKRAAAEWIGDLYDTWSRPYESHTSMMVLDRSGNQNGLTEQAVKTRLRALNDPRLNDPKFAQRVRTASSLPNVSYKRAVSMAETFRSVREMICPTCECVDSADRRKAEEKAWCKVDKIGKGIAKDIGEAVR